MAHAPRQSPARVAGERAQDAGDLAGGLPGTRGLDREHLLQVGDHRGGVVVAVVEILGDGAIDHGGGRGGDFGAQLLHVGHLLAHVAHGDGDGRLAGEGNLPGEHLVEHDAERVEVGLTGDGLSECLLGRDVVGRAEHAPGDRQALLGERARDAEVRDLGTAFLADEHVLGLDVAVHDHALVRGAERARELDRVGDRLGDGQRPLAADELLERLALHVLEHDVRRSDARLGAVLGGLLAGVDDGDDVRMVQARDRARLAAKALELIGVRGDLAMHELDRDGPLEHRVKGAVDGRHAAAADLRIEPVAAAEQCADSGHGDLLCAQSAPRAHLGAATQAREDQRGEQHAVHAIGQQRPFAADDLRRTRALSNVEAKAAPAPAASGTAWPTAAGLRTRCRALARWRRA